MKGGRIYLPEVVLYPVQALQALEFIHQFRFLDECVGSEKHRIDYHSGESKKAFHSQRDFGDDLFRRDLRDGFFLGVIVDGDIGHRGVHCCFLKRILQRTNCTLQMTRKLSLSILGRSYIG
ncbi:MAG: hypothetical protein WBQ69_11265 [Gallionella sp.]